MLFAETIGPIGFARALVRQKVFSAAIFIAASAPQKAPLIPALEFAAIAPAREFDAAQSILRRSKIASLRLLHARFPRSPPFKFVATNIFKCAVPVRPFAILAPFLARERIRLAKTVEAIRRLAGVQSSASSITLARNAVRNAILALARRRRAYTAANATTLSPPFKPF